MITIEETDDRFYISESTIPNAGRGLFAKQSISKGDFLEIIGVAIKVGSIANTCTEYANKYKFAVNEKLEKIVVPMGYAGIINHTSDRSLQNVEIAYIKNRKLRNPAAGEAVYLFIKDVEADEEIIGNYGDDWGKVLQWTEQLNERKKELPEEQWKTFLSFGLYTLGELNDITDEE